MILKYINTLYIINYKSKYVNNKIIFINEILKNVVKCAQYLIVNIIKQERVYKYMVMKDNGCKKKRKHSKFIKCDCCKFKMDLEDEREKGNVTIEKGGVTILWCNCGNEIVIQ